MIPTDETSGSDEHGISRQRKSLLICSLLLFSIQFIEIKSYSFGIGGVKLGVEKPEKIITLLWWANIYFLYRFIIFFWNFGRDKFHTALTHSRNSIIVPFLRRRLNKSKNDVIKSEWSDIRVTNAGIQIDYEGMIEELDEHVIRNKIKIRKVHLIYLHVCSFVHFVITSPFLTDYLLPFVFVVFLIFY